MKCPKCSYLGFETGDRCRNCGYDFSLIAHGDPRTDRRGSGAAESRTKRASADRLGCGSPSRSRQASGRPQP